MTFDTVIVGGGPAGLAASIYALRAGLGALMLERLFEGGQLANIHSAENYPGFGEISGVGLIERFVSHVNKYGGATVNEEVLKIAADTSGGKTIFAVKTDQNIYETRTVIVATGASPAKLNAKGEDLFAGRGVSYCATCDGAFYKGNDVAVIGGGNTALQDAAYLSRICDKIYLIHRRDRFRGENYLVDACRNLSNVKITLDTVLEEITGDGNVSGIKIKNVKTGIISDIPVSGVFIAAGLTPASGFGGDLLDLDEKGFIKTDGYMRTNVPGVFAAGDVRTSPLRQIVTAAADGAVAAHSASEFINGY